jgi:hypothetical protein
MELIKKDFIDHIVAKYKQLKTDILISTWDDIDSKIEARMPEIAKQRRTEALKSRKSNNQAVLINAPKCTHRNTKKSAKKEVCEAVCRTTGQPEGEELCNRHLKQESEKHNCQYEFSSKSSKRANEECGVRVPKGSQPWKLDGTYKDKWLCTSHNNQLLKQANRAMCSHVYTEKSKNYNKGDGCKARCTTGDKCSKHKSKKNKDDESVCQEEKEIKTGECEDKMIVVFQNNQSESKEENINEKNKEKHGHNWRRNKVIFHKSVSK